MKKEKKVKEEERMKKDFYHLPSDCLVSQPDMSTVVS